MSDWTPITLGEYVLGETDLQIGDPTFDNARAVGTVLSGMQKRCPPSWLLSGTARAS